MSLLSSLIDTASHIFGKKERGGAYLVDLGEPESVLDNNPAPYLGTFLHERLEFYEPPIDKEGLANIRKANGFHSRMPLFRRDKITNLYQPNKLLKRPELGLIIENLLVTGDAYIGILYNRFQQVVGLYNLPAVYMRVKPVASEYAFCYMHNRKVLANFYDYEVIHIKQDDLLQGIYGTPEYFGAIQSILLNEAATLFRRKYFINGAHLGSLFISTSTALKAKDEKIITEKIRQSKGLGNFRSMFLHMPGHQKASDAFQVVPVGDVATRDEFEKIKNISDEDISKAWGVRQEVAGMSPKAVGGTGDIEKLNALDYENKSLPLINLLCDVINERLSARQSISFSIPDKLLK